MSCDNQHANILYTCKFEPCKVRYKNLRIILLLSKVAFTSDKHDYSTIPYVTILASSCAVQLYTIIIPKTLKNCTKKQAQFSIISPSILLLSRIHISINKPRRSSKVTLHHSQRGNRKKKHSHR